MEDSAAGIVRAAASTPVAVRAWHVTPQRFIIETAPGSDCYTCDALLGSIGCAMIVVSYQATLSGQLAGAGPMISGPGSAF